MPGQAVRVLLVEDNPAFARLLQEMLKDADAGVALEWVTHLSQSVDRLERGGIDLVLLDLGLPDSRGIDTFLKAQTRFPEIPYVILTGLDDENLALTAVRQGAQDYLVKGETDAAVLLRSIRYAAERKKVQEALRQAHDELEQRVRERTAELEEKTSHLEEANLHLQEEISRRQETEAALQASENRYRAIFENTGTATLIIGTDRVISLVNTEFERLSGYPREEVEGKKAIEEFVVPAERQKVLEIHALRRQNPSLVPRNYELRFQDREGKVKDALVTASLIPGTQLTVGSLLDITARKQAEKALQMAHDNLELKVAMRTAELAKANEDLQLEVEERRRAEAGIEAERQRLFILLEGLPAFVFLKSPDYYVQFANRRFRELFGNPQGKHCYEILHGIQEPCPDCPQNELLKTNTPNRQDWTSTELNRTFQIHHYPFADSDGSERVLTLGIDITERKQAEEALRESVELFRAIFEGAAIGIGLADLRGRLLTTNRAFQEMLGYHGDELFAKTFTEFTHRDDLPESLELFQEMTAGKRDQYRIEKRFLRKSGDAVWVRVAVSMVKGPAGEPLYAVAMVEDITKRKEAEDALRASEEQYRSIVETTQEGIWVIGPEERTVFCNERMAAMLGYDGAEMQGRHVMDFILEEDRPKTEKQMAKLRQGVSGTSERQLLKKDGSRLWTHISFSPLFDRNGHYVGALGMFTDISQRKQAEQSLQRQREELQIILDSVPALIFYKDLDNKFVRINQAMAESLGLPKEKIDGKTAIELYPAHAEAYWQDDLEVITTGRPKRNIIEPMKTSRGTRWVQTDKFPYLDEEGNIIGVIGFAVDITERREAEASLLESEARLAEAQRIAQLGNWEWDIQTNEAIWSAEMLRIFHLSPEGQGPNYENFVELVHPEDRDMLKEKIEAAVASGRPYGVDFRVILPDGARRHLRVEAEVRTDEAGQPVKLVGTLQNITQRKEAENALKISERFLEIANREREMAPLLQEFVAGIKKFSGCAAVGIRLAKPDGYIPYEAYDGFSREFYDSESPLSLKSDHCLCSRVIQGTTDPAQPYFTPRGSFYLNHGTRFLATAPKELGRTRKVCHRFGYESMALVPIATGAQNLGLIHLADPRENMAPPALVETMERVALQLGDAIQRVRAREALRESEQNLRYLATQLLTAQERERQRIAMDLHDDLGQSLMVLKMQLRAIEREMPSNLARLRDEITEQADQVDAIVENVRRLSRDLRPTILEDLGLTVALERLLKDFEQHHHLKVSLRLEDIEALIPPEAHISIYRVFQEALTNIAKYAQATRVAITIKKEAERVSFTIQDNGKGFDLHRVRSRDATRRGLGLAAMEERIRMMKGTFAIQSQEGQGTTISFSLPVVNDSRQASLSLRPHPHRGRG